MLVERLLRLWWQALQVQLLQVPQQPSCCESAASVDPTQTALWLQRNAQLAAAVVITALVAPAFTGWLDKKLAKKNNTAEAQAPEEATWLLSN